MDKQRAIEKCTWTVDPSWDEDDIWETDCDNTFQFTTDGPKENRFKFCPYCGKVIEVEERGGDDE